jgi:hypothetical protein
MKRHCLRLMKSLQCFPSRLGHKHTISMVQGKKLLRMENYSEQLSMDSPLSFDLFYLINYFISSNMIIIKYLLIIKVCLNGKKGQR